MSESNEQEESTSAAADPVEEDQAFQETYLEATGAKSSKSRGHGYMSTHSNKRILQDRLEDQAKEIHRLQQLMAQKDAEKEAEKQELVARLKQEVMQEVITMMAQNNNLLPTEEVMHEIRLYNFLCNVLN